MKVRLGFRAGGKYLCIFFLLENGDAERRRGRDRAKILTDQNGQAGIHSSSDYFVALKPHNWLIHISVHLSNLFRSFEDAVCSMFVHVWHKRPESRREKEAQQQQQGFPPIFFPALLFEEEFMEKLAIKATTRVSAIFRRIFPSSPHIPKVHFMPFESLPRKDQRRFFVFFFASTAARK